ncbi:MAG: PhzF family phenazine biosynthesis protein [Elusimicrobiota bacterium]
MQVDVQIVNAFIDGASGGNPAGVVLDADGLTPAQKLSAARQVGLSETAFVSRSSAATVKLEFFTPSRQIAHCGHATIAAFSLMRQRGLVGEGPCSKETIDGNRDILIEGDTAFMEQRAPRYQDLPADSAAAGRALSSLRIGRDDLLAGAVPCMVDTGNSFLLVAVKDEAALQALAPDMRSVAAVSEELDLIGYYVFTRATKRMGRSAGTRMFAPRFGIIEEAGTGMAAGPLACYLHDRLGVAQDSLLIEQGWFMPSPSPSVIQVNLDVAGGRIRRLMAGGKAKAVSFKVLEA